MFRPNFTSCLRPKRSWFQFRLRTLLILVFLASVGASWFAVRMDKARTQQRAVEAIVRLGGGVRYDYHNGVCDPRTHPPVPAWLLRAFGDDFFSDVVGVGFFHEDRFDDDLAVLDSLPSVRFIEFWHVPVTDKSLEYLRGLENLEYVCFRDTNVTEQGVVELRTAMPGCTVVSEDPR